MSRFKFDVRGVSVQADSIFTKKQANLSLYIRKQAALTTYQLLFIH